MNTCLLMDRYIYAFPDYWSSNTQKNTNCSLFLLCSVFKYILLQIGNIHNLVVIIEGRVSQNRELWRMGDFTQSGTYRCPFRLSPPSLPLLVNVWCTACAFHLWCTTNAHKIGRSMNNIPYQQDLRLASNIFLKTDVYCFKINQVKLDWHSDIFFLWQLGFAVSAIWWELNVA